MIYLKLKGRLGNQIFMYATARMIQELKGDNDTIVIEDVGNQFDPTKEHMIFADDLEEYDLPNVIHVHDLSVWQSMKCLPMRIKWAIVTHFLEKETDQNKLYGLAVKNQSKYNKLGVFHIQDGYVPYPKRFKKNVYVNGFFQSSRFFNDIKPEIQQLFRVEDKVNSSNYPNLEEMKSRNSVCISIKVHANIGSPMYDVCHEDYYKKAIEYITERVENPLFFVCSDNVEYVLANLIDANKYDVVCQQQGYPVSITMGVMAQCKHFILSNSSFAWWAPYLSTNPDKIVIAPDRWYNGMDDWQYDIYEDNWVRIECK